jgi:hypothetical protein
MVRTFQRMFAAICLTAALAVSAPAQGPAVPVGSASFRNDLAIPVVIQGVSQVKGGLKRGVPIVIAPGKSATEFGVPAGMRFYNIYDANQPQRKLASDLQVTIFPGRPAIRILRQNANMQIVIIAE